ncbi:MAG: glycine oxidase ThiO [Acidobacteriota bacterium]
MRERDKFDVIIIGGGIIGLSIARALDKRKAGKIAVFDTGQPGKEASYAAGGMLAPNAECERIDDFYRLCTASKALYPVFAAELLEETGIDIELDRTGTIYAAFDEQNAEKLNVRYSRQIAAGLNVQVLSPSEASELEPELSTVQAALLFPEDWQVDNRKVIEALIKYGGTAGIRFNQGSRVSSIVCENNRAVGIETASGRHYARTIVVATGAWTTDIKIGDEPIAVKVRPIRGQMVCFRAREALLRHVVYTDAGYLVPRADRRILAGSTSEDVGFDKNTTAEGLRAIRLAAVTALPKLGELEIVDKWAGLRPYSPPDGSPVLGMMPGFENVFAAVGHFRNGILLAPLTAGIAADRIADNKQSEFLDLFGFPEGSVTKASVG